MTSIAEYLTFEHRECDRLLDPAEEHARRGRWDAAAQSFDAFAAAFTAHLAKEEQVLFPALEAQAGGALAPVAVMCGEHEAMEELLARIGAGLAARDVDEFTGSLDTLVLLIGQHNMKEEHVLYPMADRLLPDAVAMVRALRAHAPEPTVQ